MKVTLDGKEYRVDSELTGWEWRVIKQVAGVHPPDFATAVLAGDYDLMVALTMVAAARHGVMVTEGELLDLPGGSIEVDFEAAEELDPTEPAAPGRRRRAKKPTGEAPGPQ